MPIKQRLQPWPLAVQMGVQNPTAAIESARKAGLIVWRTGYVAESAFWEIINGTPPEK